MVVELVKVSFLRLIFKLCVSLYPVADHIAWYWHGHEFTTEFDSKTRQITFLNFPQILHFLLARLAG